MESKKFCVNKNTHIGRHEVHDLNVCVSSNQPDIDNQHPLPEAENWEEAMEAAEQEFSKISRCACSGCKESWLHSVRKKIVVMVLKGMGIWR